MEQKDKQANNHNDFDYANFGNEICKPTISKQKPSNPFKENVSEFNAQLKAENERDVKAVPSYASKPAVNIKSGRRISPARNEQLEKFDSSNSGGNLIFPNKNRLSIHDNTSQLKENINDENKTSPVASMGTKREFMVSTF